MLPVRAEWIPMRERGLPGADSLEGFRCETDREAYLERIARTAERRGLQPLRWPQPFPFDSAFAMRAATYAKQIGRTVPFALAAFRQAFAGGRDLERARQRPDRRRRPARCTRPRCSRARACARSPTRLDEATALAAQRGVRDVPAVWLPDGEVFHGDEALERAAALAR